MDAKNLLESMLSDGRSLAANALDKVGDHIDMPAEGAERDAMVSGMQKGALAAGALALLLGTRSGRRVGGAALKVGTVAALGGLAYNAWQKWQQSADIGTATRIGGSDNSSAVVPLEQMSGQALQDRSISLLRVMIAAARADGHIDANEKKTILDRMGDQQLDDDTLQFLRQELESDVDVQALATLADSPEHAAEMYLAARIVINQANATEKNWLTGLSDALQLPEAMVTELEAGLAST